MFVPELYLAEKFVASAKARVDEARMNFQPRYLANMCALRVTSCLLKNQMIMKNQIIIVLEAVACLSENINRLHFSKKE